jgi:choline-sulfatase
MPAKPHLLVLMSDQHHHGLLGCAGHALARTPHLDQLAAAGVRFADASCPFPLCVPSRAAFMTARACHRLGVLDNSGHLPSDVPTWAHGLSTAGYRTVLCGRMHFVGGDQHHGFLERRVGDVSPGWIGRNVACERDRGYFGITAARDRAGPGHSAMLAYDRAVAAEAQRIIYEHETRRDPRPLCLVVSWIAPHDPFIAPPRFFEMYDGRTELPANHDAAAPHGLIARRREQQRAASVTPQTTCRALAAYLGLVSFLDELIGDVMLAWNSCPALAADSIKVYTSDHGEMAGEFGLWGKDNFMQAAVAVPLILSWPDRWSSGRRGQPVSLLDVGPTLLEAAGAAPLPGADGRSLLAILHDAQAQADRVVMAEMTPAARMVRRGAWKFIHDPGNGPALFNLADDPHERLNLASLPQHAGLCAEMGQLAHSDGWDADALSRHRHSRRADLACLADWGRLTDASDPIQWAPPAPL